MTSTDRIAQAFALAMHDFSHSGAARLLAGGGLTVAHYKSILRQIYFQVRENPQLQALAAVRLRGSDRATVKMFFKHATSEIGHDQLALNDLMALGEDTTQLACEYPLPATTSMTAFAFYSIEHRNPISYLGYLYFLEHLPTAAGAGYAAALRSAGVADAAMTFLLEHASVDVAHNRLMVEYLRRLIRTDADESAVIYALRATCTLYAGLLNAAIAAAEDPLVYGLDPVEVERHDVSVIKHAIAA